MRHAAINNLRISLWLILGIALPPRKFICHEKTQWSDDPFLQAAKAARQFRSAANCR